MKQTRSIFTIAFAVFALCTAFAVSSNHAKTMSSASYTPPVSAADAAKYSSHPNRRLVMVTKQGTIKIQLFDKLAPNHVAQITELAKKGYYNGTTFHRCIPGFMIQGGDPNSKDDNLGNDGMGGYSKTLKAEFNNVHHATGICSMARTNDPNSASSQFFIMVADNAGLDHQYTVWGQVTDGMDVVNKIVNLPHLQGDNPGKAAEITKMTVEEGNGHAKAGHKHA